MWITFITNFSTNIKKDIIFGVINRNKMNNTLSDNATKLLNYLKSGSMWDSKAIDVLFPPVPYVGTLDPNYSEEDKKAIQTAHWQRDVNLYGNANERPVLGVSIRFEPTDNYANKTMEAVKELKAAGLMKSVNDGFNNYAYHYTGN